MYENKDNAPLNESNEAQSAGSSVNQEIYLANNRHTGKNKQSLIIGLLLLVIIGLIVGGFFIFNNNSEQKNTAGNKEAESKPELILSVKPADAISEMQGAVREKYPEVMPEGTKLSGEQISFKNSDKAPAWKVGDEKLYVSYLGDGASSFDVNHYYESNIEAASKRFVEISETMVESLISQGFSKDTDNAYNNDGSGNIAYTKDDTVCVVTSPDGGGISGPMSVACGQISKYTKDLVNYKDVELYAAAYEKAGKMSEGSIINFNSLNAGMLGYGYKNAKTSIGNVGASVGGAMGLFYKSPTGEWTFFTGTQAVIPCADFNTKDLQYAFAYESCYDSTKTGNNGTMIVANYYDLQ